MGLNEALTILSNPESLRKWEANQRRQKMRDMRTQAAAAIARRQGVTDG